MICSITGTAVRNRTDRSVRINVWVVTPIIERRGDETVYNFRKVLRLMRMSVIKLSTRPCFEIRLQNCITVRRVVIVPLKWRKSSN